MSKLDFIFLVLVQFFRNLRLSVRTLDLANPSVHVRRYRHFWALAFIKVRLVTSESPARLLRIFL